MKDRSNETPKQTGKLLKQKIFIGVVVILMIPFFLATKSVMKAIAQTRGPEEKIIKKVSFPNEPITFTSIESDGQRVEPGVKFVRDGDWLKDLTINFKNTSDKPIVYVSIVLVFPDPLFSHTLGFGVNPLIKLKNLPVETSEKPAILPIGETASVKLSDGGFESLKKAVADKRPLSAIDEVNYRIMYIFFEDGTSWAAGNMLRPDPERPGEFLPIENLDNREKE